MAQTLRSHLATSNLSEKVRNRDFHSVCVISYDRRHLRQKYLWKLATKLIAGFSVTN